MLLTPTIIAVTSALMLMLCTNSEAVTCFMGQQPDPNHGYELRWVLPYTTEELCQCTKVLFGGLNLEVPEGAETYFYTDQPLLYINNDNNLEEMKTLLGCYAAWRFVNKWSPCSVLCGGGTKSRTQSCVDSDYTVVADELCSGNAETKTRECNTDQCSTWDYVKEWSSCNVTCGGGTETRTQSCVNSDNSTSADGLCSGTAETETRECNTDQCPTWKYVKGWSRCNATCDGGTPNRTQSCVNYNDTTADGQCLGNAETETQECNTGQCPAWRFVNKWNPCSVLCGGGTTNRTQSCVNSDYTVSNELCSGSAETETRECNTDQCYANCSAGWAIKARGGPDSPGYTMASPDKVIACDGEVIQWRYQAKVSRQFRAVIWRPVAGSLTEFLLVGINDIPAAEVNAVVTFEVPENESIAVQIGDVIGWSFGDGVLSFSTEGDSLVRWSGGNQHANLRVNETLNFNGLGNREYSIEAIVEEPYYGEETETGTGNGTGTGTGTGSGTGTGTGTSRRRRRWRWRWRRR